MQKQESKSKATVRGRFWTFWTPSIILACFISFLVRLLACISWGWFLATTVIFGLFSLFLLLGALTCWIEKPLDKDNKRFAWVFVVVAVLITGALGSTYGDHYSTYQATPTVTSQRASSDSNKPSVPSGQSTEAPKEGEAQPIAALPTYKIIKNETIHDDPSAHKAIMEILVSGEVTSDGLKRLLKILYLQIMSRPHIQSSTVPVSVWITAFTTMEKAMSSYTSWIAFLAKYVDSSRPKITISDWRRDWEPFEFDPPN